MPLSSPSAVVLGATGAVGTEVVKALLRSSSIGQVLTLGRRPLDPLPLQGLPRPPRQQIIDPFRPETYEEALAGQTLAFCTLGVGQPSKVSKQEFHRVDVEAASAFAAACRRQGIRHFTLLTSVGADPKSASYYLRCKGEVEERVQALAFPRTSFFRPSTLITPQNRYGALQALLLAVHPRLNPLLLGPLEPFRCIRIGDLGSAMVRNAERPGASVEVLTWREFMALSAEGRKL